MAKPCWPSALAALALGGTAQAADTNDTLQRAIRADDVALATSALAGHADPNRTGAFGAIPLARAVYTQDPALVAALLSHGARPGIADEEGVTPLALACELGSSAIIAQLLDAHADVRSPAPDGTTPLAICAKFGPTMAVARMLALGARVDSLDRRGQTPLMWAASAGRAEAVALLLKAGSDPNQVSKAGFTPLFFAIKGGSLPAVDALLAAGAGPDHRGPEHTSALQLALYQNNFAAAARFVTPGADLTERDRTGLQPLHVAAQAGDTALIELLLARGANPNGLTGPSNITWVTEANFGVAPAPVPPLPPLFLAAAHGHAAAMTALLSAGADPHFVAADGSNVLTEAAKSKDAAALELALSLAPDANHADDQGNTALHTLAGGPAFAQLDAMLHLLAAHGARADIRNKKAYTAAHFAVEGRTEVKAMFLEIFPAASAYAASHPVPKS